MQGAINELVSQRTEFADKLAKCSGENADLQKQIADLKASLSEANKKKAN